MDESSAVYQTPLLALDIEGSGVFSPCKESNKDSFRILGEFYRDSMNIPLFEPHSINLGKWENVNQIVATEKKAFFLFA